MPIKTAKQTATVSSRPTLFSQEAKYDHRCLFLTRFLGSREKAILKNPYRCTMRTVRASQSAAVQTPDWPWVICTAYSVIHDVGTVRTLSTKHTGRWPGPLPCNCKHHEHLMPFTECRAGASLTTFIVVVSHWPDGSAVPVGWASHPLGTCELSRTLRWGLQGCVQFRSAQSANHASVTHRLERPDTGSDAVRAMRALPNVWGAATFAEDCANSLQDLDGAWACVKGRVRVFGASRRCAHWKMGRR